MLYGAPVWIGANEKNCNRTLYSKVQRLMNIKIATAYRTTSNDALCILTGTTPIEIKAVETALQGIRKTINWSMKQSRKTGPTWQTQSDSANKMKQRSMRFKYSQMEVRTNTELDREPQYTYRTN
jgi:hypothetical protein